MIAVKGGKKKNAAKSTHKTNVLLLEQHPIKTSATSSKARRPKVSSLIVLGMF